MNQEARYHGHLLYVSAKLASKGHLHLTGPEVECKISG